MRLHRNGRLEALNIGDSGYLVLRRTAAAADAPLESSHDPPQAQPPAVIAASAPQQHGFNHPFQIGTGAEGDRVADGHHEASAAASLLPGDLIVVASDGLWDNLYQADIAGLTARYWDRAPADLARIMCNEARCGATEAVRSPFADAAAATGRAWRGGKLDDVSVAIGRVVPATSRDRVHSNPEADHTRPEPRSRL